MAHLKWIGDSDLENAVEHLLAKAKEAKKKAEKKFGKNVIDPFSALFEISGFDIDYKTWHKGETARQAQKTLQNNIGTFHQTILGSVNGWDDLKTGSVIDLSCNKKKIIAEIKNKYSTVSGGKLSELYYSLEKLVMPKASIYKGFTVYYVAIIPKKRERFNRLFMPPDKEKGEKCPANEKIREIDGASFMNL